MIKRIGGWKTEAMFLRYNIVDEGNFVEATQKMESYREELFAGGDGAPRPCWSHNFFALAPCPPWCAHCSGGHVARASSQNFPATGNCV